MLMNTIIIMCNIVITQCKSFLDILESELRVDIILINSVSEIIISIGSRNFKLNFYCWYS